MTKGPATPLLYVFLVGAVLVVFGGTARAAVTLLGVQYQQDNPYAEYNCWYHYGNYPTSCGTVITGCNVHVFLKNTGASSVTISDVTLAGYSLKTILKRNTNFHDANSIYFYWDEPPQDILNAGEPVWYRADPNPIPAGGVARVVVRLRSVPVTRPVSIGVVTSVGTVNTTVPVDADDPVLASVGFSADRTKVYLHWRRTGGVAPVSIFMDGADVTGNATTVGDANVNFAATVLQFATPLTNMSYHVYQGVYADGKTATGSLRTWANRFIYGTWGVRETPDNDADAARAWIDDCENHGVNAYVMNSSGGLQDFMATSAGRDYAEARDYGYVKDSNVWGTSPRMWFIDDEPDIEEGNINCGTGLKIPCGGGHTTGILGLHLLEYGETLRAINPSSPTTINLDGNFKPDGWYAYGQLPDVMMVDSYYEQEMASNHWYHPERDPLYLKPTSIYAAAIATTTAAEPNPMHMILYSCEYKDLSLGYIWPFPTPDSKRVQAYYALAGGAKGMAYWWYKKGYPFNGLDDGGPEAQALWKEIGLIGNEIKTVQPLLVTGHPVTTAMAATPGVWARTLAVGVDSMILIAVNDEFYNDSSGTHLTPIANANVTVTMPSWLTASPTALAITPYGISDVGTSLSGNELLVCLGTLNVTRMVVITTNPSLKAEIEDRYLNSVRPGICAFASEHCVPLNAAPTITMHPSSVTVPNGSMACFAVLAAGTGPFSYQWQKNGGDLSNGDGISGATTAALQIADADSADAGDYRCVVTNSYGSVTSDPATLTADAAPCGSISNASFEGGNTNGVGTNWIGYQRAPNPTTIWSIQTSVPPPGGGSQYQQILSTSSAGGAGVRQDVTGCVIGVRYTISGWMRTNSASAACMVKCSPAASADWSTAIDLDPPQTTTSTTWVPFSGSVTAAGTAMTIWLDGQTGGSGLNKAACFDAILITCDAPVRPTITQQPAAQSVCAGETAIFSVVAVGDPPLGYRWQKDGADLSDGGHYAGATTPTLTISNADNTDAAHYRCVVTNGGGSTISSPAALTVVTCSPTCPENAGFESGFTGGAGNGWTKFVKDGTEGAYLSFSDETVEKNSGSHSQEVYSHDVYHDGGVYQQINVAAGASYTVSAWFKCYCPEAPTQQVGEGWLGVDPAGGTDPNDANVWWGSAPGLTWARKSYGFAAQSSRITVFLRGRSTKTPDKVRSAYVWIDDVRLVLAAPPDGASEALSVTGIQWRWADLPAETGYRVRDVDGADKSGLIGADTTQWTETTGILPNTLYTRHVHAINNCGESGPSVGQSRYSLIEPPTGVMVETVTVTSISVMPVGTLSNPTSGSSGVLILNATAGTDSGWTQSHTPWTSSGLAANTPFSFVARARNGDGIETPDCPTLAVWTLSAAPGPDTVAPSNTGPRVHGNVVWTATTGFGAGSVAYYRFAWDQNATHEWTGSEPNWSGDTITTVPTAPGTWYLHVQGCNGDDVANGMYDYAVVATDAVPADLDADSDVDLTDFAAFQACFNGPNRALCEPSCARVDFDSDADVDLADFSVFQSCYNGPNRTPACAG